LKVYRQKLGTAILEVKLASVHRLTAIFVKITQALVSLMMPIVMLLYRLSLITPQALMKINVNGLCQ